FALVLAWAYQVELQNGDASATSVHYVLDKNRKLDFIVIAALASIIAILSYELYLRETDTSVVSSAASRDSMAAGPESTEAGRQSIAVLPFINLSDDAENEYFADGLTEEILNLLVRIREIDVAARTSSFYFKGKDVDIQTVATHLGVSNVLEGSVRRQGDQIRVTAQLISADTSFHIWSETYERELDDIFDIQDDIARQVVVALEIAISNESENALQHVPTDSLAAYQYYLQGKNYLRGDFTETRLESARLLFNNALDIDGDFAEAYAGLCNTFLYHYDRSRSPEHFESAERACHRALTLDVDAVDVHAALGNLYKTSGQYDKAETEFRLVINRNSMDSESIIGLAMTYALQNKPEEAERLFVQLTDLQPGNWRAHLERGNFYFNAGRAEEAVEQFILAVNLAPDKPTGHLNLGTAYYFANDFEGAVSAWRKSLALEPSASGYVNIGSSFFFLERFEEAAESYLKASELSPDDFEIWGSLGDAYRYADNSAEKSVAAYEQSIDLGEGLLDINPNALFVIAPLAQYHAAIGNADRAIELIGRAEEVAPDDMYTHYFAAVARVSLGDNDAAMESIREALRLGYPANLLSIDAGLGDLRNSDVFQSLIDDTD
ncbi:MAG: tetratricopeptide repeat protein, partial [Gammaproteobacteria bacterium]|nr:tetratricopeptide repeat protein [Gammaproteobacteria bacterium]